MTEPVSADQPIANDEDAAKSRRTWRRCLLLFVAFVICLFSFGNTPAAWHELAPGVRFLAWLDWGTGPGRSRLTFDLISCLGVVMGIYAVFFLWNNLKRVRRLPRGKKTLGLIGSFGLILHTFSAFFLPLSCGIAAQGPAGAGFHPAFDRSGADRWVVDGNTYQIAQTYYLQLPQGLQYTIECPYQFNTDKIQMDDGDALKIAFPMMKHAYTNGLYKRISASQGDNTGYAPSRIGVALVERQGKKTRGYRVALTLDQIRERIEQVPASAPASLPVSPEP